MSNFSVKFKLFCLVWIYVALVASSQPVAENGASAPTGNNALLSSNLVNIDEFFASQLDYGIGLGNKSYPSIAYNFSETVVQEGFFESAPKPLSNQDKAFNQNEVDKCEIDPPKASASFVTVKDGKFELNGTNFEFIGFNSYQVVGQLVYSNRRNSVEKLFRIASEQGLKVTRVWLFSDGIRRDPTTWLEDRFVALDNIIEIAKKYNIKIVFAFANYWEHFLGTEQYVYWAFGTLQSRTIQDFYTDSTVRLLYKAHVCRCINRVNSISGVRWRDEPAIMAWNLMNEPRCPGCLSGNSRFSIVNDWIEEMSAFVKSIDPNHLVTTGMEGFSTSVSDLNLDNPGRWAHCQGTDFEKAHQLENIDYATMHIYPEHKGWNYDQGILCDADCQIQWSTQFFESRIQSATLVIKKPLVLEEFGMSIKMSYREQQGNTVVERDYSRAQRATMYKEILGTMLSARERDDNIRGVMFWMAIVDNYPDYDGFSIPLDDTFNFEGLPSGVPIDLNAFRKSDEVRKCSDDNSDWRPNKVEPTPLTVTIQGTSVLDIIDDTVRLLAIEEIIENVGSTCLDEAPNKKYSCQQQKNFGKCNASWMINGNYCQKTCGRCEADTPTSSPSPRPSPRSTPSPTPGPSPRLTPSPTPGPSPRLTPSPTPSPSPANSSPCPGPTASPSPIALDDDDDDKDCVDIPPAFPFSCEDQKGWGACETAWLVKGGYCKKTCGHCGDDVVIPPFDDNLRLGCTDIPPNTAFTCEQQKKFGRCTSNWMTQSGFCAITCERCSRC